MRKRLLGCEFWISVHWRLFAVRFQSWVPAYWKLAAERVSRKDAKTQRWEEDERGFFMVAPNTLRLGFLSAAGVRLMGCGAHRVTYWSTRSRQNASLPTIVYHFTVWTHVSRDRCWIKWGCSPCSFSDSVLFSQERGPQIPSTSDLPNGTSALFERS